MNTESQAREPLSGFKETDEAKQEQEEALLAVGGLSVRRPAKKVMQCYACYENTQERCSYCLLPVCNGHSEHVKLWFTSRYMIVCTPCQARLREIAREEECLWLA